MKILRSEHRRRVSGDLDYAIGLLQDIDKVLYKGYKTSVIRLNVVAAIRDLMYVKLHLSKTEFKKEKK